MFVCLFYIWLTRNKILFTCLRCMGNVASTVFVSCENRDNIRPFGVVSKNAIGARKIRLKSSQCKWNAARTVPYAKRSIDITIETAKFYECIYIYMNMCIIFHCCRLVCFCFFYIMIFYEHVFHAYHRKEKRVFLFFWCRMSSVDG